MKLTSYMKSKTLGITVGVFVAILLAILVASGVFTSSPDVDVERATINEDSIEVSSANSLVLDGSEGEVAISKETSSFSFVGYGPGKSHDGTFDELEGVLLVRDGEIVGFEGVIQASSVNTEIGGLDGHLRSADFFDVETYPEIRFTTTSLDETILTGDLTFRGVTNSLSFPVTVTEDTISSAFALNMREYGVSYVGVDDEVEISFMFST